MCFEIQLYNTVFVSFFPWREITIFHPWNLWTYFNYLWCCYWASKSRFWPALSHWSLNPLKPTIPHSDRSMTAILGHLSWFSAAAIISYPNAQIQANSFTHCGWWGRNILEFSLVQTAAWKKLCWLLTHKVKNWMWCSLKYNLIQTFFAQCSF